MGLVVFIGILVLLSLVVAVLGAPLRAAHRGETSVNEEASQGGRSERSALAREELETAREAKYREIRDAELDYRTGKLSEEDYAAVDGELRGEALEILNALERLRLAAGGNPQEPA